MKELSLALLVVLGSGLLGLLSTHLLFQFRGRTRECFMAPQRRAFRRASTAELVETLEGPVPAQVGGAIVTGSAGENYPVSAETFAATYRVIEEKDGSGIAESIPNQRYARQMQKPFECHVEWSENPIYGKIGDYLVWSEGKDPWPVAKDIFQDTYVFGRV